MSIFIASLAFGVDGSELATLSRLGILCGSTLAACLGYAVLRMSLPSTGLPLVQEPRA